MNDRTDDHGKLITDHVQETNVYEEINKAQISILRTVTQSIERLSSHLRQAELDLVKAKKLHLDFKLANDLSNLRDTLKQELLAQFAMVEKVLKVLDDIWMGAR